MEAPLHALGEPAPDEGLHLKLAAKGDALLLPALQSGCPSGADLYGRGDPALGHEADRGPHQRCLPYLRISQGSLHHLSLPLLLLRLRGLILLDRCEHLCRCCLPGARPSPTLNSGPSHGGPLRRADAESPRSRAGSHDLCLGRDQHGIACGDAPLWASYPRVRLACRFLLHGDSCSLRLGSNRLGMPRRDSSKPGGVDKNSAALFRASRDLLPLSYHAFQHLHDHDCWPRPARPADQFRSFPRYCFVHAAVLLPLPHTCHRQSECFRRALHRLECLDFGCCLLLLHRHAGDVSGWTAFL
mmetsp:Transcript_32888/g.78761  ORF Transcript_32888/g.78761 Transcript_32888/m.78761 type:complete len:300 (+) Transcript_32888:235-1134(+)